ncbi:hypothetical protein NKH77_48890 [Streptomyces sp. M19]
MNHSAHTAAAQKFIDYAIGAKAQQAFADEAYYAPVARTPSRRPRSRSAPPTRPSSGPTRSRWTGPG